MENFEREREREREFVCTYNGILYPKKILRERKFSFQNFLLVCSECVCVMVILRKGGINLFYEMIYARDCVD